MPIKPRIIIHGGAGNITRQNLPYNSPDYHAYLDSLRAILQTLAPLLPHTSALDLATHAVRLLEDNPLFNAGKGAVFNSAGVNELEASVMLSRGAEKRGVGMTLLTRVKNPVLAAREFLIRGEEKEGGSRHNFLSGPEAEKKAEEWGCEIVHPAYFWTEKRWKDHLRVKSGEADMKVEYHPLGTVGCVALDKDGTLCVATSTGGLTNKLPGRVGDTPTLGAGFWAEEWEDGGLTWMRPSIGKMLLDTLLCGKTSRKQPGTRAVAMSGTGNGDFFLRFQACHLVACRMRFGKETLVEAVKAVAGRGGEIDDGASGQAGIIGIELVDDVGNIVWDLNCGGMFRAYIDHEGNIRAAAYWDEEPHSFRALGDVDFQVALNRKLALERIGIIKEEVRIGLSKARERHRGDLVKLRPSDLHRYPSSSPARRSRHERTVGSRSSPTQSEDQA